jgi:hypothetical protein
MKEQSPCQDLVPDEKMLYVAMNLGFNSTVQCVNLGCLEDESRKYLRRSISGPGRKDSVTASGEGYYDAKWENVRVSDDWSFTDLTADLHSHADSHAASKGVDWRQANA